jgi:hypothetical protein
MVRKGELMLAESAEQLTFLELKTQQKVRKRSGY